MSAGLALGILLILGGMVSLSFGVYALLRGGRDQEGGIVSERGVHVVAGIRMLVVGALSLTAGVYLLAS